MGAERSYYSKAQIDAIPIACEEIELQDVFDPAGIRTCLVNLNPQLPAAENAANFLKKAQKLQRREKLLPQRIEREELLEKELAERESRQQTPQMKKYAK